MGNIRQVVGQDNRMGDGFGDVVAYYGTPDFKSTLE